MKKAALVLMILCCACTAFGEFKEKQIKAKKPGKFQVHITVSGVTYAADLVVDEKDQKKYFYDALTPSNIIAVRLAVFNQGKEEVVLPLDDLRLLSPEGVAFVRIDPESVGQAVLGEESPINVEEETGGTLIGVNSGAPNDPRYPGSYPPGSYPPRTYPPSRRTGQPDVVLSPGGLGKDAKIRNERKMAAVDFHNKAHTSDPIVRTLSRDRFLYFSIPEDTVIPKETMLFLPVGKGIPQEVVLKFR